MPEDHKNNVSPDEIHKFNTFAKDWWDPHGPMRPLHIINPLRLEFVQSQVPLAGKSICDVGCGVGLLSEALTKAGAQVTAIDLSTDAIQAATAHATTSHLNINYQEISAESLAQQQAGQFDVVTCMEMLEHVPDPSAIISACEALVKPGGKIFFSTINRTAASFLAAIIGAEYILRLLPRGTHHYKKFIRPAELDCWARDAGLSLDKLSGIHYNPLTEHCKLINNVSINYINCYVKPTT